MDAGWMMDGCWMDGEIIEMSEPVRFVSYGLFFCSRREAVLLSERWLCEDLQLSVQPEESRSGS